MILSPFFVMNGVMKTKKHIIEEEKA